MIELMTFLVVDVNGSSHYSAVYSSGIIAHNCNFRDFLTGFFSPFSSEMAMAVVLMLERVFTCLQIEAMQEGFVNDSVVYFEIVMSFRFFENGKSSTKAPTRSRNFAQVFHTRSTGHIPSRKFPAQVNSQGGSWPDEPFEFQRPSLYAGFVHQTRAESPGLRYQ